MIVEERVGDLFTYDGWVIGHGVNTEGVMDAGIAREFKRRWPDMCEYYQDFCSEGAIPAGGCLVWLWADDWLGRDEFATILNLFTQDMPGPCARLEWIASSVMDATRWLRYHTEIREFAIPRIGCGIGGLRWEDVKRRLEAIDVPDFKVVVYELGGDE